MPERKCLRCGSCERREVRKVRDMELFQTRAFIDIEDFCKDCGQKLGSSVEVVDIMPAHIMMLFQT